MKWELDLWYELWDRAGSQGLDTWYEMPGEAREGPAAGEPRTRRAATRPRTAPEKVPDRPGDADTLDELWFDCGR